MQWKVNSRETIYDLKNNELRITVHRISGLNGWYLSSGSLGISQRDLDTEDWKNKDKDRIADYIVSNAHDGSIVLLHDLYETSVDGALLAMERLEKEGYAFVTIDEMIKIKDIQLDINKNYYQIK